MHYCQVQIQETLLGILSTNLFLKLMTDCCFILIPGNALLISILISIGNHFRYDWLVLCIRGGIYSIPASLYDTVCNLIPCNLKLIWSYTVCVGCCRSYLVCVVVKVILNRDSTCLVSPILLNAAWSLSEIALPVLPVVGLTVRIRVLCIKWPCDIINVRLKRSQNQ